MGKLIEYDCLTEVMEACPLRAITGCEGHFYNLYSACGSRNKRANTVRAGEEAARYGVGTQAGDTGDASGAE